MKAWLSSLQTFFILEGLPGSLERGSLAPWAAVLGRCF
ncbi:hypothetical protein CYA_0006 [Synechococcus sp. JA-3-3Ab]|nr:hypothetical protein CYA_0006 [Synechococcus sp. JA-3-3Ab]